MARQGATAIALGDFATARECFVAAVKSEGEVASHRLYLAVALEGLGDRTGAAEQLTVALRLDSSMVAAAQRLCALFGQGVLDREPRLDRLGLKAALAFDTCDRDIMTAAILHHLAETGPLRRFLDLGRRTGWIEVARHICFERASEFFTIPLLADVLRNGVISRMDVEFLMTALRRVLFLEMPPGRLKNRQIAEFIIAMMQQCWLSEFVWAESAEERDALAARPFDGGEFLSGSSVAGQAYLVRSLYCPLQSILGSDITPDRLSGVVPPMLRDVLAARLTEEAETRSCSMALERLSDLSGETTAKVAAQYESSPYPRWTSVPLFESGQYLAHIELHFRPGQLDFAKSPFEVLIAGCGTGRQAVSAAFDYGPNARVLGIDITRASLGYAARMAKRMQAPNLQLALADIDRLPDVDPTLAARFHVIECGGVLHHMEDLFGAWRKLLGCLAEGGIMLIGLYSSTARRNLALLRCEDIYPGPNADERALRDYRQHLLSRGSDWTGVELTRGRDFYSASGFRDLLLHVSERTTCLPEIGRFLDETGLEFRGFVGLPVEALRSLYPGEAFPGSLARWADWEAKHPNAFGGMYQFWCTRRG